MVQRTLPLDDQQNSRVCMTKACGRDCREFKCHDGLVVVLLRKTLYDNLPWLC